MLSYLLALLFFILCIGFRFSQAEDTIWHLVSIIYTGTKNIGVLSRLCQCVRHLEDMAAPASSTKPHTIPQSKDRQLYADWYFKLHHLDEHPELLPNAMDLLISLLAESLAEVLKTPESGVLAIKRYSREKLAAFQRAEDETTTFLWKQYLARRQAGMPRELFKDLEGAKRWLNEAAPVKLIDGVWLSRINNVNTPFDLRRVCKDAWQILSEEYGDGDIEKHHVHVYQALMREIDSGLPEAHTEDFIHVRHGHIDSRVWKAAVAQLVISLFPHDFLPEMLGFNMHYELLNVDTLKAAKELGELGLNPYYFFLHISIDNADSGHTAIAMEIVNNYLDYLQKSHGDSAMHHGWRRIQTGYSLSQMLPTSPKPQTADPGIQPLKEIEERIASIFKGKAHVAQQIHCGSRTTIGGQTLVSWLGSESFASSWTQREFLRELSRSKPWVRKGNSKGSQLVQEISWKGRMFGAFTQTEVEAIKTWIDSMIDPVPQLYWYFVGRTQVESVHLVRNRNILTHFPIVQTNTLLSSATPSIHSLANPNSVPIRSLTIPTYSRPQLTKFIPLWFTHSCLLESLISTPAKTTNRTACAIIRIMRAQYGFTAEGPGVAGMDELRRGPRNMDLVNLGLEMVEREKLPRPSSLEAVLKMWPSEFSLAMLHYSQRPTQCKGLLLGLASVFAALHTVVARSDLLSLAGQDTLESIACRERANLDICVKEMEDNRHDYVEYVRGWELGRLEIESCFIPAQRIFESNKR